MSHVPEDRPARAGIGTAAAVWFGSVAVSVVAFQLIVGAAGYGGEPTQDLPFWLYPSMSMMVLWIPTLAALSWVSRRRLSGSFRVDYGFRFSLVDLAGVPIGIACQLGVLSVLYWPLAKWFPDTFARDDVERSARELTERADGVWRVVLVIAVVVGAPVIEELLYRALALGSLESRLPGNVAVVLAALWFAAAHFQGVQFLGLFVFGLVLGACWRRTGRVGLGIVTHAAFNATSLVILWPKH